MQFKCLDALRCYAGKRVKLSHSVFRVTTFSQFASTKTALQILLQYAWDFENNLTTLYVQLIIDNDHKSYDVRPQDLTSSALHKLCTDELADCKSQIKQLTTQDNCILTTLDQTKDTNSKHNKRGVILSLFLITWQFYKKTKMYSVIKYRKHSILLI